MWWGASEGVGAGVRVEGEGRDRYTQQRHTDRGTDITRDTQQRHTIYSISTYATVPRSGSVTPALSGSLGRIRCWFGGGSGLSLRIFYGLLFASIQLFAWE